MSELFFVKITDHLIAKRESYYVNCNEIKSFGCFPNTNNTLIYYVELSKESHNSMCLHRIRKSDYERLKKL